MTYEFIRAEKANFPVTVLCDILGVQRSGFYAWCTRPPAASSTRRVQLASKVRAVHEMSRGAYGSPRVHRELREQGEVVSEKTIAKVMRQERLEGRRRKRHKVTTDSRNTRRIAPNLLKRNFTTEAPNRVWVTDVTAIWTSTGWTYLSAILDLFSRRVVGWATSENNDTELALTALRMAVGCRHPQPGLIHHSDRGSPYGSDAYLKTLATHGMHASMSGKGDCWDNAVAESFFATIKTERLEMLSFPDHRAATREIADYIERFYNPTRLHSTIDYVSPIKHELLYTVQQLAA
jgi:transposase InsO family protein